MDTNIIATQFKILIDTTDKKIAVLKELLNISCNQELFLEQNMVKLPEFSEMIDEKQARIDMINSLDETFIHIYENVSIALKQALPQYRDLIKTLQEKVYTAADIDVKIKIQEQKNQLLSQGHSLWKPQTNTVPTTRAILSYQKQKK